MLPWADTLSSDCHAMSRPRAVAPAIERCCLMHIEPQQLLAEEVMLLTYAAAHLQQHLAV